MSSAIPTLGKVTFVCPHCRAHAQQVWHQLLAATPKGKFQPLTATMLQAIIGSPKPPLIAAHAAHIAKVKHAQRLLMLVENGQPGFGDAPEVSGLNSLPNASLSRCAACGQEAIWIGERIIYPANNSEAPTPNLDFPPNVLQDYGEAARVLPISPRAAAALLRLALERLCSHILGESGSINDMIATLVKRGLSVQVQQALDIVRVVGNEAVHPGTIDLTDDRETALRLFTLMNLIAEAMITQPRHVQEMYASLPPAKLKGIENRDANPKKKTDAGT